MSFSRNAALHRASPGPARAPLLRFSAGVFRSPRLVLPEAQAPQPDHDVHDDAPYSGLARIMVPAPRGCLLGHEATGHFTSRVRGLARPRRGRAAVS